jgi:signal transduction histidine kinase/CheY-like chemotaxis protein
MTTPRLIHDASPNVESTPTRLIDDFVRERFVELFLGQSRRAQFGLLAAAAIVAWIWYARTQGPAPLVWMGGVACVTLARLAFTKRFIRASGPLSASARVATLLGTNGVLMAIPLMAFDSLTELERAAVSIVLIASATASVATTAGYRLIFLAFAAPMLLPLSVAWWISSHAATAGLAGGGIAVLVFLYLLFLLGVSRQSQQVFEEASRFRYGEQERNRELQRALESASEANRAKTQFLAAASHDLRQPIHGMNVLVAALTLRELDARSREIVCLLDSVNQTLSRQLDGLLDISKLDAGIVRPALAEQRLDSLLATHHAAMAPLARERGIAYTLQATEQVWVRTDAALLTRVFSNLSDNALKFTPRGGQVNLSLGVEGNEAVVRVEDTGVGIALAEQEKVFREFYQVGNVERDRSKGLGLGLSIVRRLCDLLEVSLSLRSQPGQGTDITLRLPVCSSRTEAGRADNRKVLPSGLTVLVIDDEAVVREGTRLLLNELGCHVYLADGTDAAEAIAREHSIDAVLSDFRLRADDSGVVALEAVRRLHPRASCALVTADTAPDRIRDAESAGVPLLHKPVTLADLIAVLQPQQATLGENRS